MSDVIVDMDVGSLQFSGAPAPAQKVRGNRHIDPSTLKKIKALDAEMKQAAEKRGPWKDASGADRRRAKELSQRMTALRAEAKAQQAGGRDRELAKQAAAAEREAKYRSTE